MMKYTLVSIFKTAWKLAAEGYSDCDAEYRRKQQWKIFFCIMPNPSFAFDWFEFIKSPRFEHISSNRPRLYVKPFRPYISIKWTKQQKVKAILDTYKFLETEKAAFKQILIRDEGILLHKITFENTFEGFIRLRYDDTLRKEGELTLSFECTQLGGRISSVAFSLVEQKPGYWVCLIGCIQGHKNKNVQHAFKFTQKLLHGLRPNSLVIYATQELMRSIGCKEIHCVGNSIHISRRRNVINLPWKKNKTFDYNQCWIEIGGENINKDWFKIPLTPIRKDIVEVQSNKRSMYNKRYRMLDQLSLEAFNRNF